MEQIWIEWDAGKNEHKVIGFQKDGGSGLSQVMPIYQVFTTCFYLHEKLESTHNACLLGFHHDTYPRRLFAKFSPKEDFFCIFLIF